MIDLQSIPHEPGCYRFRNAKRKIIYIGKAKDLRKRVASYFQKREHDPKTTILVSEIDSVDFIVTDSEVEALILENNLIKRFRPRYNIDLKDSKRYAYLKLTEEDFPRLMLERKRMGKGKFFGPFTSAEERNYVAQFLKKTFRLRTCKRMPKKPCLRYHIKLCDAPCAGYISKTAYQRRMLAISKILKGKTKLVIDKMESDMKGYSQKKMFEQAMLLRDQSGALRYLDERQKMERQKKYDEDIINYMVKDDHIYLILFNISRGVLINKQEFDFEYIEGFFDDFIKRFYDENPIPKDIITPKKFDPVILEFLEKEKGSKVINTVPKIGEKKQLMELVLKNIEINFFGNLTKVKELHDKLRLNHSPDVIECFDISHLSGTSTVGSMVQFRNGRPDKSNYRRFKIRTVEGIDDFASIAEVVRRRYKRLKEEDSPMPDLIVIDGGKGQLSAAIDELKRLELRIPIISIAKREEEIFAPGLREPLILDKKSKALRFIQELRDEAHRFAINYNRLLRSKRLKDDRA